MEILPRLQANGHMQKGHFRLQPARISEDILSRQQAHNTAQSIIEA